MNEQLKMSDVFECKLPLKVNGYMVFQKENSYYSNVCESVNERADYLVAIAIAVNEYDQHVELIAKQAEQLKIMRDCIVEIRNGGPLLSEIEDVCDKVINHTKLDINKLTQAEQIKILREALQLVDGNEDKLKQSWFDCGYHKVIDAALSATEQK